MIRFFKGKLSVEEIADHEEMMKRLNKSKSQVDTKGWKEKERKQRHEQLCLTAHTCSFNCIHFFTDDAKQITKYAKLVT